MGHHKKSEFWLFNGGHLDKGEIPIEAVHREMKEEWGFILRQNEQTMPKLLTIAEIEPRPNGRPCRQHFDLWYFIPTEESTFHPDQKLLETEFHQTGWLTISEAEQRTTDPSTRTALKVMSNL